MNSNFWIIFFPFLKQGNKHISKNILKFRTSDLENAIRKSKILDGIDVIIVYLYDSDTFKSQKKLRRQIMEEKHKVYFCEEQFEDFLACHKTQKPYRDKKPRLSRLQYKYL